MAVTIAASLEATAAPEYVSPQLELRLRRMADLSIVEPASEDVQQETQGYSFRLLAGLLTEWEDGVAAELTIQSQGLWDDHENGDRLETGIAEAYISAESIGFMPLSASIGRQRLDAGRGLLLSAIDNDWTFDALDLRYSTLANTFSIKAGRTVSLSPVTDLEWIGIASIIFEPQTPFLRELEIYGGAVESYSGEVFAPYGIRVESALSPELEVWSEITAESGKTPAGTDLTAWIADIGAEYELAGANTDTTLQTRYTIASGGAGQSRQDFAPMMDRGIGGVVMLPSLSNIQIYQIGLGFDLSDRTELGLDLYQYRRHVADEGAVGRRDWGNHGITAAADSNSRDLGWEADIRLETQVRPELTLRLTAGYFEYGRAYQTVADENALEGWIELIWHY